MNEKQEERYQGETSALTLDIQITALWLNAKLSEKEIAIPINDQYTLTNLRMELEEGKISVEADVREKENSSIKLDCLPIWNTYEQRFILQEIDLKTDSRNVIIKSAGWIANTFLGAKLDKKIEEGLNQFLAMKLEEMVKNGIPLPLPEGNGMAIVKSVFIDDMKFNPGSVAIKATINGFLSLRLGEAELIT